MSTNGSIAITGTLDISDINTAVETLEKRIQQAAVNMGVSIEGLTEKMRTDFERMNETIKDAAKNVSTGGIVGDTADEADEATASVVTLTKEMSNLKKQLLEGKISEDEFTAGAKAIKEALMEVYSAANVVGTKLKLPSISEYQEEAIRTQASAITSEELSANYNIPNLQQALTIIDNIVNIEGRNKEQQQELINLRARVNAELKEQLTTTEQVKQKTLEEVSLLPESSINELKTKQAELKAIVKNLVDEDAITSVNQNISRIQAEIKRLESLGTTVKPLTYEQILNLDESSLSDLTTKLKALQNFQFNEDTNSEQFKTAGDEIERIEGLLQEIKNKPLTSEEVLGMSESSISAIKQKIEELTRLREQTDTSLVGEDGVAKIDEYKSKIDELKLKYEEFNAIPLKSLSEITEMDESSIVSATEKLKELQALQERTDINLADKDSIANNKELLNQISILEAKITSMKTGAPLSTKDLIDFKGGSFVENTAAIKQMEAALKKLSDPMGKNKETAEKLRAAIKRLTEQQNKIAPSTDSARSSMDKFDATMKNFMARMAFYVSFGAITSFAEQIISVRGEFEKTTIALGAMIQDFDKANQIFLEVQQVALKSPFTIMDLTTSTKQLSAYGYEAEELVGTMKMLAEVAAGTGTEMSRIIVNMGQVRAANVLTGRELRDFASSGIPMLQSLADMYTTLEGRAVSAGEVFERVSNRMVSYEDVQTVFENLTSEGGRFYNLQEQMSQSLAGKVTNLQDAYQIMYNEIGKANDGILTKGVDLLKWFAQNWELVAGAVKGTAAAMLLFNTGKILTTIVTIAGYIGNWTKALIGAKQAATILGNTLNTIGKGTAWGILISVIAGVATAIYSASQASKQFSKDLKDIEIKGEQSSSTLTNKFTSLADTIRSNTSSLEEQGEAYDELVRTFSGLLPKQTLEIQNLRNQKSGYEELTAAIIANNNARTLAQKNALVESYYGERLETARKDLYELLEGESWSWANMSDVGFNFGAGVATKVRAGIEDLMTSDAFSSLDLSVFSDQLKAINLINEQLGTSFNYYDSDQSVEVVKLLGYLREISTVQSSVKSAQQANEDYYYNQAAEAGLLIKEWDTLVEKVDNYKVATDKARESNKFLVKEYQDALSSAGLDLATPLEEQSEAFAKLTPEVQEYITSLAKQIEDANALQWTAGTEFSWDKRVVQTQISQIYEGANEILSKKGIDLSLSPETDFTEFYSQLNTLDSKTQLQVKDLVTRLEKTLASLSPNMETEMIEKSFMRIIATVDDSKVSMDNFNNSLKKPDKALSEWVGELDANVKAMSSSVEQGALKIAELKQQAADSGQVWEEGVFYSPYIFPTLAEISRLQEAQTINEQTLYVNSEVLKIYQAQKAATSSSDKILSNQLSLIKEISEAYEKQVEATGELTESASAIRRVYSATFNETFKNIKGITIDDLITLDNNQLIKKLKTLLDNVTDTADRLKIDKMILDLELEIAASDKNDSELNKLQTDLDSLFGRYEMSVDIEAMGEYGSLMADIFDFKTINFADLEKGLNDAIAKAETKIQTENWASKFESDTAIIESDDSTEDEKAAAKARLALYKKDYEDWKKVIEDGNKELYDLYAQRVADFNSLSEKYLSVGNKIKDVQIKIDVDTRNLASLKEQLSTMDESSKEYKKMMINIGLLELQIKDSESTLRQYNYEALSLTKNYAAFFEETGTKSVKALKSISESWTAVLGASPDTEANATQFSEDGVQKVKIVTDIDEDGNVEEAIYDLEDYLTLLKQLGVINDAIANSNPWQKIKAALKDNEEGTKDWGAALEIIGSEVGKLGELVNAIGDVANLFGLDEDSKQAEVIGDVATSLTGLGTAATGVGQIMSGDIIGGVTSVISGLASAIGTWFDNSNNEITRQVEDSKEKLKELELENAKLANTYKLIEYAVENTFGAAQLEAQQSAILTNQATLANLKLQKVEVDRQLALEKSRKAKGQDADTIAALEAESEALTSEIIDATLEIADAFDDLKEELLGTNIESIGETLGDALKQAFEDGTDAAEAWKDSVDEVINDIVYSILVAQLLTPQIESFVDDYFAALMPDTAAAEAAQDYVTELLEQGYDADSAIVTAAQATAAELEEKAVGEEVDYDALEGASDVLANDLYELGDWFAGVVPDWLSESLGTSESDLSTLSRSIEGISEESADALRALWTTSVANGIILNTYAENLVMLATSQLAVSNSIYNAILAGNTTRNEMLALMKSFSTEAQNGVKVYLQ